MVSQRYIDVDVGEELDVTRVGIWLGMMRRIRELKDQGGGSEGSRS